ncbi:MAG: hypothetical protein PHF37_01870 [Phycisphaerae bacterium]|nr:hypothetical protein [Phycisphaerae bacterium]
MKTQKDFFRLSNLLLDGLSELKKVKLRQIQSDFENISCKCRDVTKDSHLFFAAIGKSWLNSAERVISRVNRNLSDFSYHLAKFKELINADETALPKLSDIYAELIQTEQEFGQITFDASEKTLSVTTEPITLEGICLGPFEIRLFIGWIPKLYSSAVYRVIALEPNPAGSDDNITHPHVSSQCLCEGDGHYAIKSAIEQGRFCDFYTLVVNILQTYNADSPYVALSEWQGFCCYDCGCSMSDDERYYCEYCDHDYCPNCSTCCQSCDVTICLGCAYECPSCNEPVCRSCTAICEDCSEKFCKDCLNEENLCENCHEQRKENEDEEQEQLSGKPEANAPIQSDGVGKTTILS